MSQSARYLRNSILWLNLFLLLAPLTGVAQEKGKGQSLAGLQGIRLYREKDNLQIHFLISSPVPYEMVENVAQKIVVLKFLRSSPAFPEGKTVFAFRDPMVIGVTFEEVGEASTWAKIRLRTAAVKPKIVKTKYSDRIVLALEPAPVPEKIKVRNVRVGQETGGSQVVVNLSGVPGYETKRQEDMYLIRLTNVDPGLDERPRGEDDRLALVSLEKDGEDTLLRVRMKKPRLQISPHQRSDPPQLVFSFSQTAVEEEKPKEEKTEAIAETPLETLLAVEPNPSVRANYVRAERAFREGRFTDADQLFRGVYQASKKSPLGIRSLFRASDAQYERLKQINSRGYHGLIAQYQSAIRASDEAGVYSPQIPRAIYQIARSYQHMGFHFEANVHYQILQDRFPLNIPYTTDSYYYQGVSLQALKKFPEAIRAYDEFLERDGAQQLVAPALYHKGDVYYGMERFPEAKTAFDRARRTDSEYPGSQPVLLFHMGETYYENAEFDVARVLYNTLLERYPSKSYAKLVGLRLGDFLREEGKETDALNLYQSLIKDAPIEIQLRAKMRVAGVYSNQPEGDGFKKALMLYDEVISMGGRDPIVETASLRKALTLGLHNQNRESIAALIQHAEKYPDSRFVKLDVVNKNILENLKTLVDGFFLQGKHWEVVKIFSEFRDPYFRNFPFPISLFQIANSYHQLGLYDEAISLYDILRKEQANALTTLVEFQRASALADKDDLGRAEEALLRFIRIYSNDRYATDARVELGKVYFNGRRYQEALNAFLIAEQEAKKSEELALQEALPEVYFYLGQLYKELGRLKEAQDAFGLVVDHFNHPLQGAEVPEYVVLSHFLMGDVLFELKQDEEATAAYEAAIARYSEHAKAPWAKFQIGLILRRNGEERQALKVFNELVELAKSRPGELWETLARENQRDLVNSLGYQEYLKK